MPVRPPGAVSPSRRLHPPTSSATAAATSSWKDSEIQKQQRVAVGPGNAHYMSVRQVSLRAALTGSVLWPAAAAAPAAAIRQFTI